MLIRDFRVRVELGRQPGLGDRPVVIEDETGHIQLALPPHTYTQHQKTLQHHLIQATGRISKQDGTTNLKATELHAIPTDITMPPTHNWH